MLNITMLGLMDPSFDSVQLGIVVNLQTLRQVLDGVNIIAGRRWWIASDPAEAYDNGYLTIGYGDRACSDRLNAMYFRIPVVSSHEPAAGTNRLLFLLDPTSLATETPGFYQDDDGEIAFDDLGDFADFFKPLNKALISRLESAAGD